MLKFIKQLIILLFLLSSICLAEEIVTTKDGKKVLLKDNYTWIYVDPEPTVPPTATEAQFIEIEQNLIDTYKSWSEILYFDTIYRYVKLDQTSFTKDSNCMKIIDLAKQNYMISSFENGYALKVKGIDIWNNKRQLDFYIVAIKNEYNNSEWKYEVFTDITVHHKIYRINPKLSENHDSYYMSIEDKSLCPLKILAYQIDIDEYGNVNIDLILKNTSKKKIVGFVGTFEMFNKMNKPVTWGGGNNRFNFMSQDTTIPEMSSPVDIGPWVLRLYENTRKIKPYIREVQFEDGTFWRLKK
jgi:hypothetical protein